MDAYLYEPLDLCEEFLRFFGLKTDRPSSTFYWFCANLYHIPLSTLFVGACLTIFTAENLRDKVAAFLLATTLFCLYSKTLNFKVKVNKIESLRRDLEDIINFSRADNQGTREIMTNNLNKVTRILKGFSISGYFSVIVQIVTVPVKELFFNINYPFDIKESWIGYGIAAIHQTVSIYVAAMLWTLLISLPTMYIMYAVGLLKELTDRIVNINNSDDIVNEPIRCKKKFSNGQKLCRNYSRKL